MKKLFLITLLISAVVATNAHAQNKKKHKKAAASSTKVSTTKKSSKVVSKSSSQSDATTEQQPLSKQFDSLGDNQVFVERVQKMDNEQRVRIVQNRIVDLDNRVEIGGNYGLAGGGDSYVKTSNLGALLEYHFNPRWAVGLRYEHFYNSLTSEGKSYYDRASHAQSVDPASGTQFVGVDAPKDSGMLTASYAPIYGKLNLFDMGVAHFDVYTMVGYGKMRLLSGTSDTIAAGGGLAVWMSQHFSMRIEARYQTYKDLVGTPFQRRENTFQGMAGIGILL